jgi:glycerol-3-phosphate acyltransferase PlsX
LSFGALGDVFARTFFGVDDPRIALLSVGAEAGKGNRQVRETTELFESSGLNFIGNIEANEVPKGMAEVVVCDGFVGNIVMKLTEGLGQQLGNHLRSRLDGKLPAAELDLLLRELYDMSNVVESRGGGPLLGVNGVSVVGHGAARADAVERALSTAKLAVDTDFVTQMNRRLELLDSGLDN